MFDGAFYTALNLEFFGECLRFFKKQTQPSSSMHIHIHTKSSFMEWGAGILGLWPQLTPQLYQSCYIISADWTAFGKLVGLGFSFSFFFFPLPSPLHLGYPQKRGCRSDMDWERSNESSYLAQMRCCGGILIGGLESSFLQGRFSEYFEVVSLELKMKGSFAASQILCILSSR